MTVLSFRVDEEVAKQVRVWAGRLGVDESELLRDALRRHLLRLASETDAATWASQPLDDGERFSAAIADWGPAEDWADWADERGDVWFTAPRAAIGRSSSFPEILLPIGSDRIGRRGCTYPHPPRPCLRARPVRSPSSTCPVSELDLSAEADGVRIDCVVNVDNVHPLPREVLRRNVTSLSAGKLAEVCRVLAAATGCRTTLWVGCGRASARRTAFRAQEFDEPVCRPCRCGASGWSG